MALTDFLGGLGTALIGGPQNAPFGLIGHQVGVNPGGLLGQFLGIPGISPLGGGKTQKVDPTTPAIPGEMVGTPGINPQAQQPSTAQVPAQNPAQAPARKGGGIRDFLGNLGDALLIGNNMNPIYGPRKERRQMGEQLASYLGADDPHLAAIFRDNPELGFELHKMRQPQADKQTALMQNIEYLRNLNPNLTDPQLAEVAQYAIAAPRMYGSPEMGWQPDPNYPFARENAPQAEKPVVAVNPKTGERLVLRNGQWVPMGGGVSNGTGGF